MFVGVTDDVAKMLKVRMQREPQLLAQVLVSYLNQCYVKEPFPLFLALHAIELLNFLAQHLTFSEYAHVATQFVEELKQRPYYVPGFATFRRGGRRLLKRPFC